MKRLLSLLLALMMVLSMVACGDKKEESKNDSAATEDAGNESEGTEEVEADGATYTYRTTTASISTFSPTDWLYSSEWDVIGYSSSPLYNFNMNEEKNGYEVVPEAAAAAPVDVTAEYAGNETYGVPADATSGYAFKIALREDMVWDDGSPVNVDDYVYTIQQFLNPEMQNYRASNFYYGNGELANAAKYFTGGKVNAFDGEAFLEGDLFWSLTNTNYLMEDSIDGAYGSYAEYFVREDGTNMYDELAALSDGVYVAVTDEAQALLAEIASSVWGAAEEDDWKKLCFVEGESATFDQVGIIKNSDYEMTLVLANPVSEFNFYYNIGGTVCLNEEKYEANKKEAGSLIKSSYGTSPETFASYGPYKVVEFQEGKIIKLAKNDTWFGYTDGNHEGMYQTTNIEMQEIAEHTTQTSLFLQGNLDVVGLNNDDMATYGTSDYVYYTPESYNYYYSLNSDLETLKALNNGTDNHTMLSYLDFRKAMSYAIDRDNYVKSCTASALPSFGLESYQHIIPELSLAFRDTEEGQSVLKTLYGVEDVADLTGYNKEEASKLMQAAYDQAVADGNFAEGDTCVINFHVKDNTNDNVKMVDFLQAALSDAATGTSLEGKIRVELIQDPDFYSNQLSGSVDLIMSSWGGSDLDPAAFIMCWADPGYKGEYGYDPTTDMATAVIDGEEVTMTAFEMIQELISGKYATADTSVRNAVLAAIELAVLDDYDSIPVYNRTMAELYSHRIVLGSPVYLNSLIGYGGVQYMTYTMNDAEWAAYCEENSNNLTY